MKTFSVALVGPDGSGKTTISRRLQETFSLPIKYVYMGVNPESSNLMLPTTRLAHMVKRALKLKSPERGPRDPNAVKVTPKSPIKRMLFAAKSGLRLINQLAEEWFRQGLTWYYKRRGNVVLFDRHFFCDYYSYDIKPTDQKRSAARRIHGWMLSKFYPKPDLMIYLDAPADILLARKGEGTLEILEGRRQAYMEMRDLMPCFIQVDATQPEDTVLQNVTNLILEFHRNHYQKS